MDKEESKKNQNYYKNLLDSNDFNEFEEILEFLKEELSIFKLFLIKNYYKLRKVKGLFWGKLARK